MAHLIKMNNNNKVATNLNNSFINITKNSKGGNIIITINSRFKNFRFKKKFELITAIKNQIVTKVKINSWTL